MTTVSSATQKKLRDAMQRLLAGQPKRTDGKLTKANLHVEAGVSRATMNRATTMMAEWDAAVAVDIKPRAPRLAELEDTISTLNRSVAKLRQANTELERKNQAAVTVIAELHTQLRAAQQAEPTGTVTPLLKQRQRRRW